jgi:N6-adenosine-specific RNA methylase IME4
MAWVANRSASARDGPGGAGAALPPPPGEEGFVWVKDRIGTGYWCRNTHELLLIATRGQIPALPPAARVSSVISAPRSKHSEKPEAAYKMIEAAYPDLPKFELFARSKREGWRSWGDQVEAPPAAG